MYLVTSPDIFDFGIRFRLWKKEGDASFQSSSLNHSPSLTAADLPHVHPKDTVASQRMAGGRIANPVLEMAVRALYHRKHLMMHLYHRKHLMMHKVSVSTGDNLNRITTNRSTPH